jgi:putative glutamine amidotransferase
MTTNIRNLSLSVFTLLILLLFGSCLQEKKHTPLKIAISKAGPGDHYKAYSEWLKIHDTTLLTYNLYELTKDSAVRLLKECDGLLLTGGPDINPQIYGRNYDTSIVDISDHKRDSLEMILLKEASDIKMPVLGICRGMQMINVVRGGTLIRDIPTEFNSKIYHRCAVKSNCYHQVFLMQGSELFKTVGNELGIVNTNHHQGIEKLAPGLKGVAFSEDSLVEATELKNGDMFLMGVQWHPERLDINNPLSLPVAMLFLKHAETYQEKHHLSDQ